MLKIPNLKLCSQYIDNIAVCGRDQDEHDVNLKLFLEAAQKANLKFNESKTVFFTRRLSLLAYVVEDVSPDPDRLKALLEVPLPQNTKFLNRCLGLFSYYSQWVPNFSDKIKPITSYKSFSLSSEAAVSAIDESIPFEVKHIAQMFQ